ETRSLNADLAGRQITSRLRGLCPVDLQRFTFEGREGSGPRLKTTQAIVEIIRRARKIHPTILFLQNRRQRGERMILRSRANLPILESPQSLGSVFQSNWNLALQQYVAGVEPRVNAHGRNSGC